MEIWRGQVLWRGYVHPHPHTQLKSRGFPIPIPIPNQCGDSPSKRGRVRAIPTGTSLFVISRYEIIPVIQWGWDKSLISVGFGYGDGDEFFFYEDEYGIAKSVPALLRCHPYSSASLLKRKSRFESIIVILRVYGSWVIVCHWRIYNFV